MATFTNPSHRPPRLPAVATELLALSRQPDVEFKAIEALLEQERERT
jgi:HD-like signal output (HDOD) protein